MHRIKVRKPEGKRPHGRDGKKIIRRVLEKCGESVGWIN
jgi:hypothetical protein